MKMSVCGHLVVRIDALETYGLRGAVRIVIDRLGVGGLPGRSQYFSWQSNISTTFMTQRQSGSGVLSTQTHTHKDRLIRGKQAHTNWTWQCRWHQGYSVGRHGNRGQRWKECAARRWWWECVLQREVRVKDSVCVWGKMGLIDTGSFPKPCCILPTYEADFQSSMLTETEPHMWLSYWKTTS